MGCDSESWAQPRTVESPEIALTNEQENTVAVFVGHASACDVFFATPEAWGGAVLLRLYARLGSIRVLLHQVRLGDASSLVESGVLSGIAILWGSPYFCVPPNERLLGLWDTVADRLFKIRHCMNLEGAVRALPLFEPPIDPALLVRARAQGIDIASALYDIDVGAPAYRYAVLYPKAVELAQGVAALGALALSVLEKGDAEELAALRQRHEIATQRAIRDVRRDQVREAEAGLQAAERALAIAQEREQFYASREAINDAEAAALSLRVLGQAAGFGAQSLHSASGAAAYVPDFYVGVAGVSSPVEWQKFGGSNVNAVMAASAKAVEATGVAMTMAGDIVGTLAGYGRRHDDWQHQARLARLEIRQSERQIEAARLRLEAARHELAVVEQQIAQAQEVERHLTRKFTNAALYGWMKAQLAATHHQAYKLAFELARRAERAFLHERGDSTQRFIAFGHWDGLRKGLLAGEKLLHDLRRMDAAYLAQNTRELELTKMVSLAEHDPDQLVALRETGLAVFSLSEDDYDRDFATHYLRRLKTVAVTVPCTTGPYQGVHGTLSLERAATRRADGVMSDFVGPIQSIATSQGQADAGLFELSFRDERLLPFEGVGAHLGSVGGPQWRFALSPGNRFKSTSVDDLVLDVRYTARPGRSATPPTSRSLRRLVRIPTDFSDAWQAFKEGAASLDLALPFDSWTRGQRSETLSTTAGVTAVRIYLWWESPTSPAIDVTAPGAAVTTISSFTTLESARRADWAPSYDFSDPGLVLWKFAPNNKPALRDLWVIFDYDVDVT